MHSLLSRRDLLRLGAAAAGACAPRRERPPRADSVILLWLDGGPSALETFDPRPEAPSPWGARMPAIPTTVPGLKVSAALPRMARRMHRLALLRAVSHMEDSHERACHLVLTGRSLEHGRAAPSLLDLSARQLRPAGQAPATVCVARAEFACGFAGAPLLSPEPLGRAAPPGQRARFGRTAVGTGCLAALALVRAGARFVAVGQPGWDAHAEGAAAAIRRLALELDRALAALLDSLEEHGLLERTLVVCTGEFGRAPRLNPLGGRDHWPAAGFALLAGAGVPGGRVVGRVGADGRPAERAVSPQELAATVCARLGLDAGIAAAPVQGI